MQAIVYHEYGSPDVLKLEEIEKPVPKDDEVLIKVHASSINSWDWDLVKGTFLNRLIYKGIRKPKLKVIGADVAGRVEAIGENVKRFKPGDDVFGDMSWSGWGGFAEYACSREAILAHKPESMTFEQAAATPQAGVLANNGLSLRGQLEPGQKVLINGAGGGAGTFAIQIAKSFGAEVTGVDSASKLEMMRSLGADHVIDYTQEDFAKNGQRYDLILDLVASRSIFDHKRSLSSNGTYVMVGGTNSAIFQAMLVGPIISRSGGKKLGILQHRPNADDLVAMIEHFESGKAVPIIDRCYPLSETSEAIKYFSEGGVIGKLVITM